MWLWRWLSESEGDVESEAAGENVEDSDGDVEMSSGSVSESAESSEDGEFAALKGEQESTREEDGKDGEARLEWWRGIRVEAHNTRREGEREGGEGKIME